MQSERKTVLPKGETRTLLFPIFIFSKVEGRPQPLVLGRCGGQWSPIPFTAVTGPESIGQGSECKRW